MHAGGVGSGGGGSGGSYGIKDPLEELVAATPSQRNWKGIAIALLVIGAVIGLVALAVIIITPPDPGPRIKGDRLKLSDIIDEAKLRPRVLNGSWISDSEFLYSDPSGGISIRNFKTNNITQLMSNSTFRQLNSHSYKVSADLQYVLISSNQQKVYRHSNLAQYALFSVNASSYVWITLDESEEPTSTIQFAVWSPTGHSLAFVYKNDIYYQRDPSVTNIEFRKLTETGVEGLVFNGVTDWLYEEEILSASCALWFSPDGSRLLYATFNDTLVGKISLTQYSSSTSPQFSTTAANSLGIPSYPTTNYLRYPKVGTTNPSVTLTILNLEETEEIKYIVQPPTSITKLRDYYLTSASWISKTEIMVTWMSRAQNYSVISRCSLPDYMCREIHTERAEPRGWVEITGPPLVSKDGSKMLLIEPMRDSQAGQFPQLLQADANPRGQVPGGNALTHGTFTVTKIVGWDEANHFVYFIGTLPSSPGVRHLFRVGDHELQESQRDNDIKNSSMICLTCPNKKNESLTLQVSDATTTLTLDHNNNTEDNLTCEFAEAVLSIEGSFYILDCRGPEVPFTKVFSLPDNEFISLLDANDELKAVLETRALPWIKTMSVSLPDVEVPARVRIILPPGLREHEEFIFPVVFNVYGGPGTQDVSSRWSLDWDHYLASNRDFIVIHMDVRGSGFAGNNFKHAVFHQLGKLEVQDSLYVLEFLLNNLTYVDKSKVAVWGWSYGGFLASKMLAEDTKEVIKCAAAVAPVTRWELYDSAYTERYMGSPDEQTDALRGQENFEGYKNADLTRQVLKFIGRNLLLVHGTSDNNVHFQQMAIFTKALVEQSILFRQQIYPDEGHSIPTGLNHLFSTLEDFFEEKLGPLPDWFSIKCIDDGICYS